MIIARTPFRVSFFGGGTDFPDFFRAHGGATLSVTLDKFCYLSVHECNPLARYAYRVNYSKTEDAAVIDEIQHPLVRETLRYVKMTTPLEISHNADLPGRTGLGTSSSFTVGLLNALYALQKTACTPEDLALGAIRIERERVGDPGGWQDQYAAAYGGFLRLDYQTDGAVQVKNLPLTAARIKELEDHILLFYTGSERNATALQSAQKGQIKDNEQRLLEMKGLVDEAERALMKADRLHVFGELLHETWIRKRALTNGITNPLIDQAYEAARAAGALGGKLLGAGGHGFLLIFAPPDCMTEIRRKLAALKEVPVQFCSQGSQIIFKS